MAVCAFRCAGGAGPPCHRRLPLDRCFFGSVVPSGGTSWTTAFSARRRGRRAGAAADRSISSRTGRSRTSATRCPASCGTTHTSAWRIGAGCTSTCASGADIRSSIGHGTIALPTASDLPRRSGTRADSSAIASSLSQPGTASSSTRATAATAFSRPANRRRPSVTPSPVSSGRTGFGFLPDAAAMRSTSAPTAAIPSASRTRRVHGELAMPGARVARLPLSTRPVRDLTRLRRRRSRVARLFR